MYLQNKYSRYYFNIINAAKSRLINSGYTEKHHIIPKSLGGNNSKDNLVILTAKEHFICHLLLTKMTEGKDNQKMLYAAWAMSNQKRPTQERYTINSKTYENLRKQHSIISSISQKNKIGPNRGKKLSIETKEKMSKVAKGRKPTPQAIEAAIKSRKGIPPSNKGKPMSQEQKDKIRKAMLLRWSSV